MTIPWKWMLLAALAATLAVVAVLMVGPGKVDGATISEPNVRQIGRTTTAEPTLSYEELTKLIGPVAY